MPYTPNAARDSVGDERRFMQRFQQHQAAIVAYKQRYGGDLEGAYRAVTGESWPSGRSVKIKNGIAEMTKDRTVKSVLGKYIAGPAAVIGASIFAPQLLPSIGKAIAGPLTGGAGGAAGIMPALSAPASVLPTATAGMIGAPAVLGGLMPALSAPASVLPPAMAGMIGTIPPLASRSLAGTGMSTVVPGAGMPNRLPTSGPGGWLPSLSRLPGRGEPGADNTQRILAAALPFLMRALGGVGGGDQDSTPELRQIQELTRQRMLAQNPLFEAATRTAYGRLPVASRAGLQAPSLSGDPMAQAMQHLARMGR